MSVRLYVGNLPKESVERQSLQDLFVDLAEVITIKIIKDRKTNKCRGFAFVTVPTDEIADQFIEKYNGLEFIDGTLKIEKALPRVKGKGKEEEEGFVTEELENTEQTEDSAKAEVTKPTPATGERKRSNKKQRPPRGQQKQSEGAKSYSSDDGSVQPDPRWASELAKLKDMLSTQTANT